MADIKGLKNIGIIGAGRIAHSLVPALIKAGYKVASVSGASKESVKSLVTKNKIKNTSATIADTIKECGIIFIALPDHAIEQAASEIARAKNLKGKLFIHLSGSKTVASLKALSRKGGAAAGIHIMQTFPGRRPVTVKGCYASVEGNSSSSKSAARKIASDLGTIPFYIEGDEKMLLHIMCVFASNFINAGYYNALLLHRKIKSKIPPVEKLLYPLSITNLNNIKNEGIFNSLSGPIARKDYDTVNAHLDKLFALGRKEDKIKDVLESYTIQTLSLLAMNAEAKGKIKNVNSTKLNSGRNRNEGNKGRQK